MLASGLLRLCRCLFHRQRFFLCCRRSYQRHNVSIYINCCDVSDIDRLFFFVSLVSLSQPLPAQAHVPPPHRRVPPPRALLPSVLPTLVSTPLTPAQVLSTSSVLRSWSSAVSPLSWPPLSSKRHRSLPLLNRRPLDRVYPPLRLPRTFLSV